MADNSSTRVSRRKFIAASGTAGALALAGCTSNDSGDDGGNGGAGGDNGGNGDGSTTTEGGSGGSLSGEINVTGSSTVYPLAQAVAEEFMGQHDGVNITIQSTGSGGGFQNYFCVGDSDINNASRPIAEDETQLCSDNGVTPVELKVATDALTVVVNNEADFVDEITFEQLDQIWSAEEPPTTWSDVDSDWPDEELNLFGPTEASGTYDYFLETVIGEEGPGMRTDYQATENDRQIVQGVQGSQYAMGFFGFAYYSNNPDVVKALSIEGGESDGAVEPSLETAKSGDYPLARPLFTYPATEALADEHVAEFARYFVEQSTNQELVAGTVGYVPNSDEEMQEAMDALDSAIESA
ncbi:PstS family phosphate ABC transporter substrate-binding protein [Halomarina oriensis]|uniref:Phosphate ABC transporter substrate-binding protein PstS family protein n=1 Tax=Halomarina oriensis TaxID=671145 RepID=A0A6B0GJS0_9EURY|nr:PstS family phosphate ABC transporter substrate-binding protein [Halomarina oriensis]MWG34850.1 phosphate ABC transporter substrate-binding protein PstS family protein [Halomarina oriensis]